MDDDGIVALFFARSERAVEELAAKYGGTCRGLARNILRSDRDAEECVNDTYLGVWNTVPPQRPNPLKAYVLRITRNLAVKRYHRNTAQKRGGSYDAALDELEECLADFTSLEDLVTARELSRVLDAFLDGLDENDRYMFVRRYWYAEPVRDIARRMDMTANSAAVRLYRIRGRLRDYLIREGYEV